MAYLIALLLNNTGKNIAILKFPGREVNPVLAATLPTGFTPFRIRRAGKDRVRAPLHWYTRPVHNNLRGIHLPCLGSIGVWIGPRHVLFRNPDLSPQHGDRRCEGDPLI